ncbi:ABC transporter ATP-binding protein [Dethiosulfatarculus sandiegensis]|uniref:ABC transporter ATP-binding protein n=1 Tax=Dethiosulfatarculus sandiegensis TaxID=1429043 RepID=UPI0009E929D2|nr:ABC transporter ATP-binding protein [Dethiosulfatarculus sandiegensis]
MQSPAIETRGLLKNYGSTKAVAGLDLKVETGQIYGFLGPNGAGKTTTCRILTTLTKPTGGQALVSGFDVVKEPSLAKKGMGLVPQHLNLDPDLTIYENLKLHGMLHGMAGDKRESRIREMLEFTDLWDRKKELAKSLSGGLKRRLMIARALLHEPRVLFLDEPTVGLDAHTRRRMWELISQSHRRGVTIFLTTHYIEEAESLCHRVGIINQGSLIAEDTPQGFLSTTGKVVVESYSDTSFLPRFFDDRKQAAEYAATRQEDTVIRASNLEDVFISLTGRGVMEEKAQAKEASSFGHGGGHSAKTAHGHGGGK